MDHEDGKTVAYYYETGEHWGTIQKALRINSSTLYTGVKKNNYKLFWIFRDLREPSNKARERFESMMDRSEKTFIVWIEGDGFKFKELKNVERISQTVEEYSAAADCLKSILEQYSDLNE